MATIRFTENGKEFPLPHNLLKRLAASCPDGPLGREIARELIALGIPSVTEELVDKDFLSPEERDAIWESGDVDVRRQILRESEFLSRLTDAQAREIIEQDDVEMLKTVAEWLEYLYPGHDGGHRISGAEADRLAEHIRTHENTAVRAALAENSQVPPRFSPPLAEYIRNGYNMRCYSYEGLTEEDVALLKGCSREVLEAFAWNVEDIKDKGARKAAVTLLATHPDPQVRYALASNTSAPRRAFELLAADPDPAIAAEAAENLGND